MSELNDRLPALRPDPNFWKGRRVLVTGHTGFKGCWLSIWLQNLGAALHGLALSPDTSPNLFDASGLSSRIPTTYLDIRNSFKTIEAIEELQPEFVFHLAAQPLVRLSYDKPIETFDTNVLGTASVLEALKNVPGCKVAMMITTDKVYHNNECGFPYRETDRLGGHDPYSASKAAAELIIDSYKKSFFSGCNTKICSARSGNVIGGGDWSKDRLIPDAVRAWQSHKTLEVRRPSAVRPWQHVLEPVNGYIVLAEKVAKHEAFEGAFNFGPDGAGVANVREVIEYANQIFGSGQSKFNSDNTGPHEAKILTLETTKIRRSIGLRNTWGLREGISRTISWYRNYYDGQCASELCQRDIDAFSRAP